MCETGSSTFCSTVRCRTLGTSKSSTSRSEPLGNDLDHFDDWFHDLRHGNVDNLLHDSFTGSLWRHRNASPSLICGTSTCIICSATRADSCSCKFTAQSHLHGCILSSAEDSFVSRDPAIIMVKADTITMTMLPNCDCDRSVVRQTPPHV